MDEEVYMVCMRPDELDDPVEGSTMTACVECGGDVWISPASRKEMYERRAMPLCTRCAARQREEHPGEVQTEVPSRSQFDEIINRLRGASVGTLMGGATYQLKEEDDLFQTLKDAATEAGARMRTPTDDWTSMLVMVTHEDVVYPPLPLGQLLDKIPKEVVARQLVPALAHIAQAKRIVFGLSAWTIDGEKAADLSGSISEHPDRQERLLLIDITAEGIQKMAWAEITRSDVNPPTLGEWQDSEKPEASDGLFVDALLPALRSIKEGRGD